MPEGPEVKHIADNLQAAVAESWLTGVDLAVTGRYGKQPCAGFESLVFPMWCSRVLAVGKKLIIELKNQETTVYGICFLGMAGHWQINPVNPAHCVATLYFQRNCDSAEERLCFIDSRHFGSLEFGDVDRLTKILLTQGPDWLVDTQQITPEYFAATVTRVASSRPNLTIANFLLEQQYFAGVGNYLRAEILYACCISPWRLLNSLNASDLERIRSLTLSIIAAAYAARGHSITNYKNLHGEIGIFKCVVYGCTHDPFGNKVVKESSGGPGDRSIHWVPEIQH